MPHLLVSQGPNRGQRFDLIDRNVLGRKKDVCTIWLRPADTDLPKNRDAISRRHAMIVLENDLYYLVDGDGATRPSHNGTFVNNERIQFPDRRQLKHNDVIRICDYLLLYCDDTPVPTPNSDESSLDVTLSQDDKSVFLAQPEEKLKLLLEISNELSHTLDPDALLPKVVGTLLDIFKQADRSFLIQVDGSTGKLIPRISRARPPEEKPPGQFSGKIVEECLKNMKGLIGKEHDQGSAAGNMAGSAPRSVMCAPLWSKDNKALGVLLVESHRSRKKFMPDDLNLLMGVADQACIALANAQYYRDALNVERNLRDLALARQVVESFLPEQLPKLAGYEFYAAYDSALAVGGDYYDVIPLMGQRQAILVGDVSGHGVTAALVMTRFSAEARVCLRTEPDLSVAVRKLNALMQPLSPTGRYLTLAVLQLDPAAHTITMVNAGHPPPLILRRASGKVETVNPPDAGGPPLGVVDACDFQAHQFTLEPGDRVILYSDGITEATDANNRQFGRDGLCRVLANSPASLRDLGDTILQAVDGHIAGREQDDDMTLVCFGRIE